MSEAAEVPAGVLAAEFAAGARRWEMPALFGAAAPAPPPTAHRLEELEAAAREEGYGRGLQEGHADGFAAGASEVRAQTERLAHLIDCLARPLAGLDAEVERTLAALAVDVARRLVNQQLQLDPTLVTSTVQEALAALQRPPREVRVHVHPDDARMLEGLERDRALVPPPDVEQLRIVADPSLRPGDCRLHTENGQVDATLLTRQAGIVRTLLGEHE